MLILTVISIYCIVFNCEHDAVNGNKKYRKGYRNGKKLMQAYLYSNQFKPGFKNKI